MADCVSPEYAANARFEWEKVNNIKITNKLTFIFSPLTELIMFFNRTFYNPNTFKAFGESDEIPFSETDIAVFSFDSHFALQEITYFLLVVIPLESGYLFLPYRPRTNTQIAQRLLRGFFHLDFHNTILSIVELYQKILSYRSFIWKKL